MRYHIAYPMMEVVIFYGVMIMLPRYVFLSFVIHSNMLMINLKSITYLCSVLDSLNNDTIVIMAIFMRFSLGYFPLSLLSTFSY